MKLHDMVEMFPAGGDLSTCQLWGIEFVKGYLHYLAQYMIMQGVNHDAEIGIITARDGTLKIGVIR